MPPTKWTRLSNSPRVFHVPYSQENEVQTPSPEVRCNSPQHSLVEPHREITQLTELLLGTPTLSLSQGFPASLRFGNRRLSWDAAITYPQVPPGGAAGSRTNQRRPASGTFPSLGPCPPPGAEPGRRQLTVESGAHPPITGTRARLSLSGLRGAPRGAWGACPDGAPPPGSTPACCSCPSASRSGAAPRSFSRSSRTPRPAATPS